MPTKPQDLLRATRLWFLLSVLVTSATAQGPPYDVFPEAKPPYYRVRYEASEKPGELLFAVNYTVWIPPNVRSLRGVVVHQHGCGEGSCKSGLTGAFDLHWQALAQKHDCALLSPSYEQPQDADCQLWCDPRNGSSDTFQKCLADLGEQSGHAELAKVPWALWGHSGGGHWCGGMVMLHPQRVAAAWLRSGVPMFEANPDRASIKPHELPAEALAVPIICNPGTKEGVTVKDGRFARVWPANETFFHHLRSRGGLIGVAVDPLTAHECGNQRYMAIAWLDACLSARLPKVAGETLKPMPTGDVYLAKLLDDKAVSAADFSGDVKKAVWLPNKSIAEKWMQYVNDTKITDDTPPPAPTNLRVRNDESGGNVLTWEAQADIESGLAHFIILRDGEFLAKFPEEGKNPFGRPIFQNLQYSDTPTQPLVPTRFVDKETQPDQEHTYRIITVNTVGLKSKPSAETTTVSMHTDENAQTQSQPNIVLIYADDLGYGDVACYNPKSKIPTPNIDSLAKAGMRFTNAYAPAAVCVPSRYALLTGRHAFRGEPLRWGSQPTINEGRTTLASLLKGSGYETACVGKWHCGFEGGVTRQDQPLRGGPLDRGFDHFFGQHGSLDQPPYFYVRDRTAVEPATEPIAESHENSHSVIYQGKFWRAGKVAPNFKHEEVLDRYASEAVQFLKTRQSNAAEKPFFLYFAMTAPHGPWLPAKQFHGKSEAGPLGDFVVHVDHVVGQVLTTLDDLGLTENTLVLFSSDNGPLWFDDDVKRYGHDSSGGLRGRKGDIWEGGVRMPLIARWPGHVPQGSSSDQIISQMDFLATVAAIVDEELPEGAGEDSFNMLPVLLGEQGEKPARETLLLQSTGGNNVAIRKGDWKLIPWLGSGGFLTKPSRAKPASGESPGQLYNLREDPGEQNNLYAEQPEIVDQLSEMLKEQRQSERTRP